MIKTDEMTLDKFSEALAAKISVPGGGGAAAYAGALGCALIAMAANFTIGKKKFSDYERDLERIIKRADELREEFVSLVEKDAECFEPLSAAYKIDKDDPKRDEVIEAAVKNAAAPPVRMAELAAEGIELVSELENKCSAMLISDVACAAALLKGAMESAAVNVYINTSSMRDAEEAREIENSVENLLEEHLPEAEIAYAEITEKIKNGGD